MTSTTSPGPRTPARIRPASPAQLEWLARELPTWQRDGLLDARAAAAILARYHPSRRFDLSRLLLTLGAAFVGLGILWLVASNLDRLAPLTRFLVVAGFWLLFLTAGELLASRREHGGDVPSPVVGAMRGLAALTFGAVVMQAAQSLQVPAYEPVLLACWGLGALVHAYVVRGTGPLVVGLLALGAWLLWQTTWEEPDALTVLLVLFAGGALAAGVAALHAERLPRALAGFAAPWREAGAVLSLGALFVAALPFVTSDGSPWTSFLVVALALAAVAVAAAAGLTTGTVRLEPLVAVAIGAVGALLVLWDVGADFDVEDQVGAAGWAHATLGVVAYVAAAAWFAVLGVLRDSRLLTLLATAAVVLFTTAQAFSVFAAIVQGAWLFVLMGLVLAGTGYLADRGRRQLARHLADEPGPAAGPGTATDGGPR